MSGITNNYECLETFEEIDVALGFLLTIGIIISFLPQIIVLIFKKNVDGLSVISCCFNYVNCMCNYMNILYLNWFVFDCCNSMTSWTCFRNLLPMVQMLSPFMSTLVIFILYTIYRPRLPPISEYKRQLKEQQELESNNNTTDDDDNNNNTSNIILPENLENSLNSSKTNLKNNDVELDKVIEEEEIGDDGNSKKNKNYVGENSFHLKVGHNRIEKFFIKMDWYSLEFFWTSIVFSVIFFFVGLGIALKLGGEAKSLNGYAFALGILASILVFLQWLPQIYTTWLAQEIGTLSLTSLCIQAPGSLLVVIFQWKQNWSTWFPYLATAIQAFILIGICIYFKVRDRKLRKAKEKLLKEEQEKEKQSQEDQVSQKEEKKEEITIENSYDNNKNNKEDDVNEEIIKPNEDSDNINNIQEKRDDENVELM